MAFDINFDPSMDSAVDIMKNQLQRRSRASSPSQEAQQWSWYSIFPQLGVYDDVTVNILLNVSKRHLSTTFAVFSDFEADHNTRVELCLAMAAIGGLYCTTSGSAKVAKMLFNDSRRLMLEDHLLDANPSFEDSLSFAKTFILLELYGLCSGDKRAYEFMEVFHGNKVHAMTYCLNIIPRDASASQHHHVQLIVEAMNVLDSYRVLLLQRPPSFAGDLSFVPSEQNAANYERLNTGGIILKSISNSSVGKAAASMHHLATIIRYSWMASPRDTDHSTLPSLWKAEFVETALDQWIRSKSVQADLDSLNHAPEMLLYHLTQVTLHSNMGALQRLAQTATQGTGSSLKDNDEAGTIQPWATRRQFDIALWHAKVIFRIAEAGSAPRRRRTSLETERLPLVEPPHLPLCIYFATLIVWHGKLSSWGNDADSGDALIEVGSQLMLKLKTPVAKVLGTALCELLAVDGCGLT